MLPYSISPGIVFRSLRDILTGRTVSVAASTSTTAELAAVPTLERRQVVWLTNASHLLGAGADRIHRARDHHPIGSSLLSGYFPSSRGSVLALNSSIAAVGSLVAAPLAALLLAVYGWRAAFVLGALAGMVIALAYLLRPDRRPAEAAAGARRPRFGEGGASYRRVLRNR
jgi:MFS family permease